MGMGALERLQNYSRRDVVKSEKFDVSTPAGALLSRIHNEGYKLYDESGEYTELYKVITCPGNQVINAVAGSGKALRNGTGVLTARGYVPVEALSVGDMVFGSDGCLHSVVGVFPQGRKQLCYVRFGDGVEVPCSPDHLWGLDDGLVADTVKLHELLKDGKVVRLPALSAVNAYVLGMGCSERVEWLAMHLMGYADIDSITDMLDGKPLSVEMPGDQSECIQICQSLGIVVEKSDSLYDLRRFVGKRVESVRFTSQLTDMTCISVDSEDHLFVTEGFTLTHNTTAMVLKLLYDIVTGECMTLRELDNGMKVRIANNVWVCTFLRSGAEELEAALVKWQHKFGYSQTASTVTFSTMDAEFKRCLNSMGVPTVIGDSAKLYQCMVKAIDSCNIKRGGYMKLSKEDYTIIGGIITYYRGRLDDRRYSHPSCADYGLTPTILDLVVRQFAQQRKTAGVMDFEEVMELLYKYLYITPNKAVQDFVSSRFNFIYIDEFQDTSQMAYAILKFYARGKLWINRGGVGTEADGDLYTGEDTIGKLVVIGDTSQCVPAYTTILGSRTADGTKVGNDVKSVVSEGVVDLVPVSEAIKRDFDGDLVVLTTQNNFTVSLTPGHMVFVRGGAADGVSLTMFGAWRKHVVTDRKGERHYFDNIDAAEEYYRSVGGGDRRFAKLIPGSLFSLKRAGSVCEGDYICTFGYGGLEVSRVVSVGRTHYTGKVYDFNVNDARNFIADGVVVHNCIYSFRGSDSTILSQAVDSDFRPVLSTLSVNWRCPDEILRPIVPSIHKNADSASQDIRAARDGGEMYAYSFRGYKAMIARLKDDITQDMLDGMAVAVLCRTNFDGLIPAVVLEQDGRFDFSVSGEGMTMSSPLPRKLIGMSSLFTERGTPSVRSALAEFSGRSNGWALMQLMDALKGNNLSIWDIPIEDIRYSCPVLVDFVREIRSIFYVDGKRDKSKEMSALRAVYLKLLTDVYAGDSAYCESARAYIETILYIIDSEKFQTVFDFLQEMEYLNDKLLARVRKRNANIRIATVHEFKGKEADSVYIWNDNEGVFPYVKCDLDNENELNEERRVHYIACTRARKREHIYCLSGKEGMFVREMDLKLESPVAVRATLPKKVEDGFIGIV